MDKIKILLVDDDIDLTFAVKAILESKGFLVDTAHDSKEGMEKLKNFNPNLLILDVNMDTEYEGFDMNREIRKNEKFRNIPILMLTGIDVITTNNQVADMYREMRKNKEIDDNTALKLLDEGNISIDYKDEKGNSNWLPLDGFLSKPVEEDKLMREIKKLIDR